MLITNLEAWICLVVVIGFRINSLVGATYEDNVVDCRNNTVQIAIWTLHLVRSILCFWKQECGTNDMNVKKWSPWTPLYKSLHSSGTITQISNFAISTRSTASHDVRKAGFDANAWIDSNRKIKDVCQRRTQRGEFTTCIAWIFGQF